MQTEVRTEVNDRSTSTHSNGEASPSGQPTWRHRMKRLSFNAFIAMDRLGMHVLPKHFYTPVPDYSWLREHKEAWVGRAPLRGVHWDLREQLSWLTEVCQPYYSEVEGLGIFQSMQHFGPGFGPIESQVLHCIVSSLMPPRIIEIGSGASSAYMRHAVALNRTEGKLASQITCIEPYPKPALRGLGDVTLVEKLCQFVPSSVFAQLQCGDLLFIDSSHSVKIGSELQRIYLDILPSLPAGVLIHIHDINLPYLYPTTALLDYFGWQETVLLLSLLTDNNRLSVLACLSALHHDEPDNLSKLLKDYQPQATTDGLAASYQEPGHFPSSCWLVTK